MTFPSTHVGRNGSFRLSNTHSAIPDPVTCKYLFLLIFMLASPPRQSPIDTSYRADWNIQLAARHAITNNARTPLLGARVQ